MKKNKLESMAPIRDVPPMGGFSFGIVQLEVKRLLRNRRNLIATVVVPVIFFLIFGLNKAYANQKYGKGNIAAFIMVSMALYGAVLATTSGGAMVSIERALGWSRQLRVTPLTPTAYIAIKMVTSLLLGLLSVVAVYLVGIFTHQASMPFYIWIVTGLSLWIGSLLFAAFGLFLGYLLPSENVMQIMGFALMLFSFGGGLFIPLSQFSHPLRLAAEFTPLYGLNQLVHYPLIGGSLSIGWILNLLCWLAIFSSGAIWLFSKDTKRV